MMTVQKLLASVVVSGFILATFCNARLLFKSEHRSNNLRRVLRPDNEEKVWLFAVDGVKKPYSFMTPEGTLVGFDVDLINAVCKRAFRKCKMVLAPFTDCSFSPRDISFPGVGLMSGQFDACTSYAKTVSREAAFDYSDSYLTTTSTFAVAIGNPSEFDPDIADYSTFKLGHLTGADTDSFCLYRLNKKYGKFIIFKDLPEAREALQNRTVDAVFSPRTRIDGVVILPQRFRCDNGGAGLILKKGSGSGLTTWWNAAFRILEANGQYRELCNSATHTYNYTIKCLPDPLSSETIVGL